MDRDKDVTEIHLGGCKRHRTAEVKRNPVCASASLMKSNKMIETKNTSLYKEASPAQ